MARSCYLEKSGDIVQLYHISNVSHRDFIATAKKILQVLV